jgi:hypothetical protein
MSSTSRLLPALCLLALPLPPLPSYRRENKSTGPHVVFCIQRLDCAYTNNMNTTTQTEAASNLSAIFAAIQAAEAANRSVSTLNRLWRKYFQAEDALKAFGGW